MCVRKPDMWTVAYILVCLQRGYGPPLTWICSLQSNLNLPAVQHLVFKHPGSGPGCATARVYNLRQMPPELKVSLRAGRRSNSLSGASQLPSDCNNPSHGFSAQVFGPGPCCNKFLRVQRKSVQLHVQAGNPFPVLMGPSGFPEKHPKPRESKHGQKGTVPWPMGVCF